MEINEMKFHSFDKLKDKYIGEPGIDKRETNMSLS
jgi:hypothetical protein